MIKKAKDVKLHVVPVSLELEHKCFFEGPCRFGRGEELEPGFDRIMNDDIFEGFMADLRNELPACCTFAEPIRYTVFDDFVFREDIHEALEARTAGADLFVFNAGIATNRIVFEFAQRHPGIPLAIAPDYGTCSIGSVIKVNNPGNVFLSCYCWEDLARKVKALHARKVIASTSVLCLSRMDSTISMSSEDSFRSHAEIMNKFGVHFRYMNIHEFLDQMELYPEGGNHTTPGRPTPNLTPEELEQAEALADELMGGCVECDIERWHVVKSCVAYLSVLKNMELRDCNAFVAPCPDICATRRVNQMQFTFCLTHSLNAEQQIPSACEYDLNAALAQQALIAVSGQCTYMGNTFPVHFRDGEIHPPQFGISKEDAEKLLDNTENLYYMQHAVPHRCLRCPGQQEPVAMRHFAYEQKFGAVMRYDFDRDKGQVITLCRFSPDGRKMLVGTAEIVASAGYELDNCNGAVIFRVKDVDEFFEAQSQVGNHLALVYGDYAQELEDLAKIMRLEVLRA